MTSNRPIEDWGKLLQDIPSAIGYLVFPNIRRDKIRDRTLRKKENFNL